VPNPWDRLDDEPLPAYAAFMAYRDLGLGRTVTQAYRQRQRKPDARQVDGTWNKWVKQYRWHERVAAWDASLAAVADKAREEQIADDAKVWAKNLALFRTGSFRPFKLAAQYGERIERQAEATGQDIPVPLITELIALTNSSRAAAKDVLLGFAGGSGESAEKRIEVPDDDVRKPGSES
jgi:hypothetical protein